MSSSSLSLPFSVSGLPGLGVEGLEASLVEARTGSGVDEGGGTFGRGEVAAGDGDVVVVVVVVVVDRVSVAGEVLAERKGLVAE